MERWIIVFTRHGDDGLGCIVCEAKFEAIEAIKSLLVNAYDIEDISVYHSDRASSAFIDIA